MSILSRLAGHRPLPPTQRIEAGTRDSSLAEARPPGCGWFDSSHELRRGLLVREHASADALAAELPLTSWLELHLSGWRPTSVP